MTSPVTVVEPLLANSMRVLRNITAAQDLIAAYSSLKQKSLASPPALTEFERRLLLDLPDEDMETSNIAAVTSLSRVQLIEKAISDRTSLTLEEAVLLSDRFWTHSTNEENSKIFRSLSQEELDELDAARQTAYSPARAALPDAKEWIQYLYRQEQMHWGFVCLYDADAQQLDPGRLDDFNATFGGFFQHALQYNGSWDIINQKWYLMSFNSPNSGFAPIATPDNKNATISKMDYQGGAVFRKAFQELLRDPQEYQKAEDVKAVNAVTHQYKNGIAASGILTNTFLVIDPICVDSVIHPPSIRSTGKMYDNMRILAFEVDYPIEGWKYAAGYQGFVWVRLDQLVYNFYELRLMKANEVGMDEIWKAAQESRHGAFVSMDPEEARSWTKSRGMSGFTPDSVIGKRFHAIRDAKRKKKKQG